MPPDASWAVQGTLEKHEQLLPDQTRPVLGLIRGQWNSAGHVQSEIPKPVGQERYLPSLPSEQTGSVEASFTQSPAPLWLLLSFKL